MSVIIFDRQGNFSGLQEVAGQEWLVLDAKECRFPLLHQLILRVVIMLLGEVLSLEKSTNLIFEAAERVAEALKRISPVPLNVLLEHVIRAFEQIPFPHTKLEYIKSALTEIYDLQRSMGVVWNCAHSDMMDRLLAPGRHTVIRTAVLDIKEELLLLAWMLVYAIHTGLANPRSYQVYFLVDEVQHLFNRAARDAKILRTTKNSMLTGRQPRVAVIGCSQMPSLLEPEFLASSATTLCTGLQDAGNIREVAGAMGIPPDHAHDLFQSLAVNEAVYLYAGRPGPFKIDVPLAPIPKGCDEVRRTEKVRHFLASCRIEAGPSWEQVHAEIVRGSSSRPATLSDADTRLLREAALSYARPLCLSDLAAKSGQNVSDASNSSKRLEQLGYGERQTAAIGRYRRVFLEPIQKSWDFLALPPPVGAGRGNAPHRYCLSLVEDHLAKRGFRTEREVEVKGKRVDLRGRKGQSEVFVELEMTAKNAARNASADLAAAGPEVIQIAVVCPTEAVLKQVRKAVESAVDAQSLGRFVFKVVSDL